MKREDIQQFKSKVVLIELDNTYHYTAKIDSINEETINVTDKFGLHICINISSIKFIKEIKYEAENE